MLSLGLAAGAVMLAEQLDTSFHTVDDLRTFTRVPVLVSIPRIVTEADASRRRWRFRLAAAVAMLGLALIIGASYLVAQGSVPLVGPLARSLLLRM
jgi:peptidoglycan/LPS O-acetylase OafA/YrhL